MEYMHAARQKVHIRQHFQICRLRNVNGNQMQTGVIDDMISKDKSHMRILLSFPTVNTEHIASIGIYINAVALWIVFCKYCSHRNLSLLIVEAIIHYKNQKHFNQFTMSHLFCVIICYIIFLVSASLRSVQSGHPLDVLHPCICPYQSSQIHMGRYNIRES